jgi:hypothetical protein
MTKQQLKTRLKYIAAFGAVLLITNFALYLITGRVS